MLQEFLNMSQDTRQGIPLVPVPISFIWLFYVLRKMQLKLGAFSRKESIQTLQQRLKVYTWKKSFGSRLLSSS